MEILEPAQNGDYREQLTISAGAQRPERRVHFYAGMFMTFPNKAHERQLEQIATMMPSPACQPRVAGLRPAVPKPWPPVRSRHAEKLVPGVH